MIGFCTPGSTVSHLETYMYASGVVLASALSVLIGHPNKFSLLNLGMKIRVATCSLLYRSVQNMMKYLLLFQESIETLQLCIGSDHSGRDGELTLQ